jgi:type II secretory pathway pseudopilin PulG
MKSETKKVVDHTLPPDNARVTEAGFSLVEVTVAFAIFFIAMLAILASFTFAVNYNAGNSSRAQALAILQEKVEVMRSKKFTPGITDPELYGGTKTPEQVTSADGNKYRIQVIVDNDPYTAGVQDETTATTMKEVSVIVSLDRPTPGWQTAVPAKVILRRTRAN